MQYNLLTLQLLTEGFTVERYPDFVEIDSSRLFGNNPLHNLGGGFVYKKDYRERMVFKTPCGLFVKGEKLIHNMSYMGIDWQAENNNPVINCPYRSGAFACDRRHLLLQDHECVTGNSVLEFCDCHRTEEEFEYERSLDRVLDEQFEAREEKYRKFVEQRNGQVCRNHAVYDEKTGSWSFCYNPERCAHMCNARYCPVLGRDLQKKKANVYYDLYTSGVYEQGLICQEWKNVQKGIRYFDKKVSIDICEAFVKLQADAIENKHKWNHSHMHAVDSSFKAEIRNIRVKSRLSRDQEQDLKDIQEGHYVSWAPDEEKKKMTDKRERRRQNLEKRIRKMEKKILQNGYEGLDAADKIRADKLFSTEHLEELEEKRMEELQKPKLVQISLLEG